MTAYRIDRSAWWRWIENRSYDEAWGPWAPRKRARSAEWVDEYEHVDIVVGAEQQARHNVAYHDEHGIGRHRSSPHDGSLMTKDEVNQIRNLIAGLDERGTPVYHNGTDNDGGTA